MAGLLEKFDKAEYIEFCQETRKIEECLLVERRELQQKSKMMIMEYTHAGENWEEILVAAICERRFEFGVVAWFDWWGYPAYKAGFRVCIS